MCFPDTALKRSPTGPARPGANPLHGYHTTSTGPARSAAARGCHCHCRVWGAPPRRCMELQLRESQHFAGVTKRWLHLLPWPEWVSKPGVDTRSELQILNPHTMRAGVDFAPELNIYYYIVPGIHSGPQPFPGPQPFVDLTHHQNSMEPCGVLVAPWSIFPFPYAVDGGALRSPELNIYYIWVPGVVK